MTIIIREKKVSSWYLKLIKSVFKTLRSCEVFSCSKK